MQRISLVVPPALPLLASLYLATLSLRRTQIKNSLILIEAFVFFGLCVGELAVLGASAPARPSNPHTYGVADRAIGALSAIPLLAYTTFLPIFTGAAVLPYIKKCWHMASLLTMVLAIPTLLVLQELASLDGVVYTSSRSGVISPGYASTTARHMSELFTIVALSILVVVQLIVSLLCLGLIHHIDHVHVLGGSIPGITVQSMVMFGAGTAIGALDAGFGLVPSPIFATVLFRRIIEALSRLLIIASLVCQHSSEQGSSRSLMHAGIANTPARGMQKQKRRLVRRSSLFNLIGNPRYSTFAHLGGDNAAGGPTERRRQQLVTVSYDYVNPPVLDVRFSMLDIPQIERVLARVAPAASRAPRPMASSRNPGNGDEDRGRSPDANSISRNISLRANASLYRHRPEYFYPRPPEPVYLSQQVVVRPDSPTFGREPTVELTTATPGSGNQVKRETNSSYNTDVSGRNGDYYSTAGILSQFPDTPVTKKSGPFPLSRTSSRNRLIGLDDSTSIPLPARQPHLDARPRVGSAASKVGPPPDLTDGAGDDSSSPCSTQIVTVDSRARVVAVPQPSEIGPSSTRSRNANNRRHSFLELSDGETSPSASNTITSPGTSLAIQSNEAASQNKTHRRLGSRYHRIPTAELAPMGVFRERFAERRRGRSESRSAGTSGEMNSLLFFSSPSPSAGEPRLPTALAPPPAGASFVSSSAATATGIGTGTARDSSAAFRAMGSDDVDDMTLTPAVSTRERSHWSETNDELPSAPNDGNGNFAPPTGVLSRVETERTTPSPKTVPTAIGEVEQRGSVVLGVAH